MNVSRGIAVLAVAVLAGCSAEAGAPAAGPVTADSPGDTPTTVTTTLSPAPTDAAQPPDKPEQATAPPPSIAGPVKASNLPSAALLGAGWKTYADPGGAEDGFQGNDTWTRRRDPHQAAYEALPVGCARPLPDTALPVPRHALQGAYRNAGGGPATVLVLRFAKPAQASVYFQGYGARMRACGRGQLTVEPLWSEPMAAGAIRRYAAAETFVEVSVVRGSSVGLLANTAGNVPSDLAWSRTAADRLASVVDR